MSKVTVYQYMVLGTNLGEPRQARRWGTREAVEGLKGSAEILEDTAALAMPRPSNVMEFGWELIRTPPEACEARLHIRTTLESISDRRFQPV
jgi:hypothetical protein